MRFIAILQIGLLCTLLAACGSQPPSSAVVPSSPPVPTVAPTAPAAPTQAPEATAPQATQPPASTSAPTATETPAPTDEPPAATQAPATAKPAAPTSSVQQPSGDATEELVTLHRSGGIAGITESMTVYADGRLEFSGDVAQTQAQVAPSELAMLRQLLASPEFAALNMRYSSMGADLFTYQISVPDSGKNIVTMDGAKNPPVLDQVLAELQQLMKHGH